MIEQIKIEDIPILDLELLKTRENIGVTFLPKLIRAFNMEVPKLMEIIQLSYQNSDYNNVKELGHKLKGMCLNMGALRLSEIGRRIEDEEGDLYLILGQIETIFNETMYQLDQTM